MLSSGGLGFLVSHEEADDNVSGWRFFAKKHAKTETEVGVIKRMGVTMIWAWLRVVDIRS